MRIILQPILIVLLVMLLAMLWVVTLVLWFIWDPKRVIRRIKDKATYTPLKGKFKVNWRDTLLDVNFYFDVFGIKNDR